MVTAKIPLSYAAVSQNKHCFNNSASVINSHELLCVMLLLCNVSKRLYPIKYRVSCWLFFFLIEIPSQVVWLSIEVLQNLEFQLHHMIILAASLSVLSFQQSLTTRWCLFQLCLFWRRWQCRCVWAASQLDGCCSPRWRLRATQWRDCLSWYCRGDSSRIVSSQQVWTRLCRVRGGRFRSQNSREQGQQGSSDWSTAMTGGSSWIFLENNSTQNHKFLHSIAIYLFTSNKPVIKVQSRSNRVLTNRIMWYGEKQMRKMRMVLLTNCLILIFWSGCVPALRLTARRTHR